MSDMEKNLSLPTGLRVFSEGQWVEVCSVRDIERLESELAAVRLDIIICKNNCAFGAEEEERPEAELAEANAKIERYEHWIFSCNDCGPAEYAQRQLLSPQGSLAGSIIQGEDDQC